MTQTTHRITAAECFVIMTANNHYLSQDPNHIPNWDDEEDYSTGYMFDRIGRYAVTFPTVAAARQFIRDWNMDTRKVTVARRAAQVALTEAGRTAVADRRAARNADRKF